MASEVEASCLCDPNFAVICSFLEKFATSCGITYPNFSKLQEMLENTVEVSQVLIDLHVKLLRKARKSVSGERWEKAFIKFCHTYSSQDGWEIERFGYKKARLGVKLRLLKSLLETQFDLNGRFKTEINRLNAEELRLQPIGRDKLGQAYWSQLDEDCNLRVYREDLDDENWDIVARDREGLVQLITQLSSNEPFNSELENLLNEDSNSQDIEKPITDTGQVDDSPGTEDDDGGEFEELGEEEEEAEEEEEEDGEEEEEEEEAEGEEDEDDDVERTSGNEKKSLGNQEKVLSSSPMSSSSMETKTQAKLSTKDGGLKHDPKYHSSIPTHKSDNALVDTERIVKPFKLDLSKHMQKKKSDAGLNLSKNDSLGMDLSSKKGLDTSQNLSQLKSDFIKAGPDDLKLETIQDNIDAVCDLTTKNTQYMKQQEEIAKHIQISEQNVATDLCIRNLPNINALPVGGANHNLKTTRISGKRDFKQVVQTSPPSQKKMRREEMGSFVGEAIEEPLMLVRGEGSGNSCDTGNPGKSSDSSDTVDKGKTEKSKTLLEGETTDKHAEGSGKNDLNTSESRSPFNCLNKGDDSNNDSVERSGCDVNKNKGAIINSQNQSQSKQNIEDNPNGSSESNVVQDKSAKEYVNIKLKRVHSFEANNESVGHNSPKLDDATLVRGNETQRTEATLPSDNKLTTAADTTFETRANASVSVPSTTEKLGRSSEAPLPATKRYLHSSTNLSQSKSGNDSLKCVSEISPVKLTEKSPPKLWSIDNICAPDGKSDVADTPKSTNIASHPKVESTADKLPKISLGVQLPPKSVHPLKRSSRWDVGKPSEDVAGSHEHSAASCKDNVPKQLPAPVSHDIESSKSETVKDSVPQPYKDLKTLHNTDTLNLRKEECPISESDLASSSKLSENIDVSCKEEGDPGLTTKPPQRFFFGPGCLQFSGVNKLVPPVSVESSRDGSVTENKLTSKIQSDNRVIEEEKKSITDVSLSKSKEEPSNCTSITAEVSETDKQSTPASNETKLTEVKNQCSNETQEGKSTKDVGLDMKTVTSTAGSVETNIGMNRSGISETAKSSILSTQTIAVVPPSLCKPDLSHDSKQQSFQDPPKKREFLLGNDAKSAINVSTTSDVGKESSGLNDTKGKHLSVSEKCSKTALSSAHDRLHHKLDGSTTLPKEDSSSMNISAHSKEIAEKKSTNIGSDTKTCTVKDIIVEPLKSVGAESSSLNFSSEISKTSSSKVSDAGLSSPILPTIKSDKIISPTSEGKLKSLLPSEAVSSQAKDSVEVPLKALTSSKSPLEPLKESSITSNTNNTSEVKGSLFSAKLQANDAVESKTTGDSFTTQLPAKDTLGGKHLLFPTVASLPNQIPTIGLQQSSKLESLSISPDRSKQIVPIQQKSTDSSREAAPLKQTQTQKPTHDSSIVTPTLHAEVDLKPSSSTKTATKPEPSSVSRHNKLESKDPVKTSSLTDSIGTLMKTNEAESKPSKDSTGSLPQTKEPLKTTPSKCTSNTIPQTNEIGTIPLKDSSRTIVQTQDSVKLNPAINTGGTIPPVKKILDTKSSNDSTGTMVSTSDLTGTKLLKDSSSTKALTKEPILTKCFDTTSDTKTSIEINQSKDSIGALPQTKHPIGIKPSSDYSDSIRRKESPIETKPSEGSSGMTPQIKDSVRTKPVEDRSVATSKNSDSIGTIPIKDSSDTRAQVKAPSQASSDKVSQANEPIGSKPSMVSIDKVSEAKESIGTKLSMNSSVTIPQTKELIVTKPANDSCGTTTQTIGPIVTKSSTDLSDKVSQSKEQIATKQSISSTNTTSQAKEPIETQPSKGSGGTITQAKEHVKTKPEMDSSETALQGKETIGTKPTTDSKEAKQPIGAKPTADSSDTASHAKQPIGAKPTTDSGDTTSQAKPPIVAKSTTDSKETVSQAKQPIGIKPTTESKDTVSHAKQPAGIKPTTESKDTVPVSQAKQPTGIKPTAESKDTLSQAKQPVGIKPTTESEDTVSQAKQPIGIKPTTESKDTVPVSQAKQPTGIRPTAESKDTLSQAKQPVGIKPTTESKDTLSQAKQSVGIKPTTESKDTLSQAKQPIGIKPTADSKETVPVPQAKQPIGIKPTADSKETVPVPQAKQPIGIKPTADSKETVPVPQAKQPTGIKPTTESKDTVSQAKQPVGIKPTTESKDTVSQAKQPVGIKPTTESKDTVSQAKQPVGIKPTTESKDIVSQAKQPIGIKPTADSKETVPAPQAKQPTGLKPTTESKDTVSQAKQPVGIKPTTESKDTASQAKEPIGVKPTTDSSNTVSQAKQPIGAKPSTDSSGMAPQVKQPIGAKPTTHSSDTAPQAKQPIGTTPSKDSSIIQTKEPIGTTPRPNDPVGTKPWKESSDTTLQAKDPIATNPSKDSSSSIPQTKELNLTKPSMQANDPIGTKGSTDSIVTIPQRKDPAVTTLLKYSSVKIPQTKDVLDTKLSKDSNDATLQTKETNATKSVKDSNNTTLQTKEPIVTKPLKDPSDPSQETKDLIGTKPTLGSSAATSQTKDPMGTQPSKGSSVTTPHTKDPNGTKGAVDCSDTVSQTKEPIVTKPGKDSIDTLIQSKEPIGTKPSKDLSDTTRMKESFKQKESAISSGPVKLSRGPIAPTKDVETNSTKKLTESTSTEKRPSATTISQEKDVSPTDEIKECNVTKVTSTILKPTKDSPPINKTTSLKSVEKELPVDTVTSAKKTTNTLPLGGSDTGPTKIRGDQLLPNKPVAIDPTVVAQDLTQTMAGTVLLSKEATGDQVAGFKTKTKSSEPTEKPTEVLISSKESATIKLHSTPEISPKKDKIVLKSPVMESTMTMKEESSEILLPNKSTDKLLLKSLHTESKSTLNDSVAKPAQEAIGALPVKTDLASTTSTVNEFIKLKPISELLVSKTSVVESAGTTPCKDKPVGPTLIEDGTLTNKPLVGKSQPDKEPMKTLSPSSETVCNAEESTIKESSVQVSIASKSTLDTSTVEKHTTKESCKAIGLSLSEKVGPTVTSIDKSIQPKTADELTHPLKETSVNTPSEEITKPTKELINTDTLLLDKALLKDDSTDKEPCSKESNDDTETTKDTSTSDSATTKTLPIADLSLPVGSRKLKPTISVRSDLSIKKCKIDDTPSSEAESVKMDTAKIEVSSVEKMEESIDGDPVQTRRKGKLKKPTVTEPEEKLVEVSKVVDEPKPTILGLSLDYNPEENVPKVTTRTTRPKLKVKKIETMMEVNTNSLDNDDECPPTETDPLADYDDLIPVTVTRGKKNAQLPPPPPVVKRKRRSGENEADDGGKRARQLGKEVISDDEVVEEHLLTKRKGRGRPPKGELKKPPLSPKATRGRSKRVSSTDSTDKDSQPPQKAETKPSKGPRGRRKQVLIAKESSSDGDDIGIDLVCGASSEDSMPVAKKQTPVKAKPPRKTRRVLGLEVPVELDDEPAANSGGPPMRQSRRIAQIKIKEEAERRHMEEMTLTVLKHEQREKHAHKADKQGDKKKRIKSISDDYSAEGEEQDEDFSSLKKQKKKRKKREKKWTQKDFDESKPWQSSSGSSTSQEEEDEEIGEQSEEDERIITTVLKSDHEFSPESDLEDGTLDAQPTRLARTAQKVDTGVEDAVDDAACQKCKASDHPEWILLCDKCDAGWHASCLRPALFVIPEGDWYCPPCQHTSLVVRLHEQLREVDRTAKRRDNEELRKKRLAYVGISLDNVLTKDAKEEVPASQEESGRESGPAESSSGSSRSGSDSGDESEPIYQLRERRAALFSYRFNEYDDLINSAIQDELEAVNGAGNQGRGKDIATIVNAEKEEAGQEKPEELEDGKENDEEKEDDEAEPEVEEEEEEDGYIPPVKKFVIKKKHRKLNSLDISSEDDPESDEDFKGSSSEGDEEDYEEDADSDDSEMRGRGRGRSGPVRRSARARTTRFDREFLDDDDSDEPRKKKRDEPRKKKRGGARRRDDTSDSEESDSTWGRAPKRPRQAPRTHAPRSSESKKKKSKKKKRIAEGSDVEPYKASKPKKPRVKYGGLDESEDVYTARRTRGCKINYVEMGGTDSEEEKYFRSSRTKKLESEEEDEYVVNEEEEEEMMELEEEGKETENESAEEEHAAESDPSPQPTPEPEPAPEVTPISEQEVDTKVGRKGKSDKGKGKTGVKKSKKVKKVEPLIIATTAIVEESEEEEEEDEEEEESLSLVVEPQEPVINEAELVKEQKRLQKEVKKLEKKEQKKRGKRKKSELEPGEVAPSVMPPSEVVGPSEALLSEAVPSEVSAMALPAPMMPVMDSPTKRKGRGRGKAALAKAAAAEVPVGPPQGFPPASSPAQGNSVISRMLQSQPVAPARTFADAASVMGQKYFGDQLLPPRPPFLPPVRGRHPSPYRRPRSPGVPPYPGPRPGRPPHMYHTSHHPLDPSPSGGGPITIDGTPPPYGGRGGPPPVLGRFAPDSVPTRHPSPHFPPAGQSASPGRSPAPNNFTSYHPPPNYHYGAYPIGTEDALPPAAYQGSSYPETYTSSPLHTSESSNSKPMEEEGSGEFGGLVSYFSSQREDDLDA